METETLSKAAAESMQDQSLVDKSDRMEEDNAVDDIQDDVLVLDHVDTGQLDHVDSQKTKESDSLGLSYSGPDIVTNITGTIPHGLQADSMDTVELHGDTVSGQAGPQLPEEDVNGRSQDSQKSRHRHQKPKLSRWFYSNRFKRYWKHQRKVWTWFQKHQAAQYKARCEAKWQEDFQKWYKSLHSAGYDPWAAYMYMYYMPMLSQYVSHPQKTATPSDERPNYGKTVREQQDMHKIPSLETLLAKGTVITNSASGTPGVSTKRKRKRKSNASKARKKKAAYEKENTTSTDHQDVLEMEITEDMLDFFAHSAKHRKERDSDKNADGKTKKGGDKHVPLEGESKLGGATEEAPSERPGVRRTFEMKSLYGRGAAMIHGMETAIQLNFDRNSDIRQPKFWPALPLNIKFD